MHIYALVYWIVGPSILGPLLQEHDDGVQQPIYGRLGLINVGTKFA